MTRQNDIPVCSPSEGGASKQSPPTNEEEENAAKHSGDENENNSNARKVTDSLDVSNRSNDTEVAVGAGAETERSPTENDALSYRSPDSAGRDNGVNLKREVNEERVEDKTRTLSDIEKRFNRETMQTALIPLWDMCNHQDGHVSCIIIT